MLEAFRVGPVITAKGQATLFAAALPTGVITSIAASAAQALAELRLQAGAAATRLVCEPALAAAGRPLGFQPAALSTDAMEVRSTLTTMLALGLRAEPAIIAMVPRLIDVGVKFHAAAPWQLVAPETPIEITLDRLGTTRRCVASVFRVASGEAGIALHDSADVHASAVAAAYEGTAQVASVQAVTLGTDPAFVADAVHASHGARLAVLPTTGNGPRQPPITPLMVCDLTAVMFAVTQLAPGRPTADVTLELTADEVWRCSARLPAGHAVAPPPPPPWTTQPPPARPHVPSVRITTPVLPVTDLPAAIAALRVLGFEIREAVTGTAQLPTASVFWPGLMLELVHVPGSRGGACHVVVDALEPLVNDWRARGVEVKLVERAGERIALLELPGELVLTVADQVPAGYQPPRAPRRARPRAPKARS